MDKALVNEQELRTLLVERWRSLTMMGWKMFLDDLSFDILEALKNVDDDKKEVEEDESSFKKRKKRKFYSSRTREVVVDDDSDEEYTPPKVRF